jgi:putative aldouronate transport system permease protein
MNGGCLMLLKPSKGERVFDIINVMFFCLFCLSIIVPFLRLITFSLSKDVTIAKGGFYLIPTELFVENWRTVLVSSKIWNSFFQTVFVTLSATS